MHTLRMCEDLDECYALWQALLRPASVFDPWEVRACFQSQFRRPPCFLVAEDASGPVGLLPLSYIAESDSYGYFPGETWAGKTWLEQNRVIAPDRSVCRLLLEHCPPRTHLRYLAPDGREPACDMEVDEVGFLFHPGRYDFEMANYWQEFSGKSRKRLRIELDALADLGCAYRHDEYGDLSTMLEMNLAAYGESSYFRDGRFREAFLSLFGLLRRRGQLRITTVLIDGQVAAVDAGAVFGREYTLIAGGTDPRFPGVAKLINLHHMAWACERRMRTVDFLCGDFGWKERFHLSPRPLYQWRSPVAGPRPTVSAVPEAAGNVL